MFHRVILTVALLFISTMAFAHGTGQHVLGTVTAIDEKHIEIRTPKGATVSVQINKQTRFKAKRAPKSTEPPEVGDRVVVEATKEDKVLIATEVHFSAAKRVPPSAPIPDQPLPSPAAAQ
ncbi:MAG TPA: DUF5666 domain-containing protein [Nitrospira sp.]|nr:DUF5666 domain-containing protein [Nitrospira sp.]